MKPPVYSWKPINGKNFGDELGWMIAERILKRTVSVVRTPLVGAVMCAGTVIEHATEQNIVWSCGTRGKPVRARELDIRAVRGPLSYSHLCCAGYKPARVFGDAGLLFPRLFPEIKRTGSSGRLFVRHYKDCRSLRSTDNQLSCLEDPLYICQMICNAEKVYSSSLHGIILADAYGVPASWIRHTESMFKFADYFESTGRCRRSYFQDPLPPPVFPDLKKLEAEFPADAFVDDNCDD